MRKKTTINSNLIHQTYSLQDLLSDENMLSYLDIDVEKLRIEFEQSNYNETSSNSIISPNIGSTLWEYRRSKWLYTENPSQVAERIKNSNIDHLPNDCYPKLYTQLVEKGKTLRMDKKLNLSDVVKIINVGWIVEEKWDRAAKGLP